MRLESLSVVDSLAAVDRDEWNALAGEQPFVRHEFFSALLDSGSAVAATGWRPQFLLLRRSGVLAGAMPLFAKTHSYGEYVFDWAWADAHERHGVEYYPKLLCAIPFTPVQGTRILGEKEPLIRAALEMAKGYSSLHVLFSSEAELLEKHGLLLRRTVQFHWKNEGYADFEDFLARLSHARRKNIKQERRRVREAGVTLRVLEGAGITPAHWEFFSKCYRRTYAEHRSSPYLSLDFFLRLGKSMAKHLVLVLAERNGKAIASSLLIRDEQRLYGRYWGALEYVPLLHF